jgi:hypothetical protein
VFTIQRIHFSHIIANYRVISQPIFCIDFLCVLRPPSRIPQYWKNLHKHIKFTSPSRFISWSRISTTVSNCHLLILFSDQISSFVVPGKQKEDNLCWKKEGKPVNCFLFCLLFNVYSFFKYLPLDKCMDIHFLSIFYNIYLLSVVLKDCVTRWVFFHKIYFCAWFCENT